LGVRFFGFMGATIEGGYRLVVPSHMDENDREIDADSSGFYGRGSLIFYY